MKNKIILFLVLCFCFNLAGFAQSTVHESVKFQSKKLGKEVSYSIYLPDGYNSSERYYPVLYLLHGYTDNETMWIQTGQMQEITDRAICSDQAVPMIVVMPDAWDTWYINQYDGKVPYEDMFFEELIPISKRPTAPAVTKSSVPSPDCRWEVTVRSFTPCIIRICFPPVPRLVPLFSTTA